MPETVDVTGLVLLGKSENRKPMGFLPSNIGLSGSNFPIIQFYEDGMISIVTKMLGILMGETIYQPG
jgi:hypothetical protein